MSLLTASGSPVQWCRLMFTADLIVNAVEVERALDPEDLWRKARQAQHFAAKGFFFVETPEVVNLGHPAPQLNAAVNRETVPTNSRRLIA